MPGLSCDVIAGSLLRNYYLTNCLYVSSTNNEEVASGCDVLRVQLVG
jgi:hypothetical protein